MLFFVMMVFQNNFFFFYSSFNAVIVDRFAKKLFCILFSWKPYKNPFIEKSLHKSFKYIMYIHAVCYIQLSAPDACVKLQMHILHFSYDQKHVIWEESSGFRKIHFIYCNFVTVCCVLFYNNVKKNLNENSEVNDIFEKCCA